MKIKVRDRTLDELSALHCCLGSFTGQNGSTSLSLDQDKILDDFIREVYSDLERVHSKQKKANVVVKIEAEWSGYRSGQARLVHREYRKIRRNYLPMYLGMDGMRYDFSDNTSNIYSVVEVAKSGKDVIHGYDKITDEMIEKRL